MKNFVQNGSRIAFASSAVVTKNSHSTAYNSATTGSGPLSGEAGVIGRIVGVVVADAVVGAAGPTNDGNTVLETAGCFNIPVLSTHHTIAVGSTVYIDPVTGVVSDDYTAVPYGCVADAVAQYTTVTVRVKLFGATPGAVGADS